VAAGKNPPDIIVIVAEGTGFPFEDPTFSRYPSLRRLRASSRPFDDAFSNNASWANLNQSLLGGAKSNGASPLVAQLRNRSYSSTSIVSSGKPLSGFDRAVIAPPEGMAESILKVLAGAGPKPAFVFASLNLRSVAPGPAIAPAVPATPLEVPAIALSDRAPLDPVRFPVTPPPRPIADQSTLTGRRHSGFKVLDREVGAVLSGLTARSALEDTVIVLISAGPAPRPERAAPPRPDLLFEDWLRGLILIDAPGLVRPGVAASTLATMDDIAPTLAKLAGAVLSQEGGSDLGPSLRDPEAKTRETLLSFAPREAPRVGRSVRTQRFRFTQWPDGSEELFDEEADPNEWTNIANVESMASQKAQLARHLTLPGTPPSAAAARPLAGRRPNVLMIIGDDLTAQYGGLGDVKTPNLDRLRARGRVFERAYAPAPFCTPSRAAFLSGLSPARLRLEQEHPLGEILASTATPRVPLIQEQFRANGYFTASVGKVWDSQPGEKLGWDLNEWNPPLPAGMVELPPRLLPDMPIAAGPTDNTDEVEGDGRRAALAIRVLEEKREKPLFLTLGLVRPHPSWVAPQKYFDLYPVDRIRFTRAPENDAADIPAIAIKNRPQGLPGLMLLGREPPGFSNDDAEAKRGIAAYLACVTFMDAQLGLVLDALDRTNAWKDTIVVLLGDNGHHLGDHGGLWRKNTLFEESLRVPLIISAPGMRDPGKTTKALADLIDVYPTLVDLTGISKPGTLDGVSLLPTLNDANASVRNAVIQYRPTEPSKTGYSLRTSRNRYTLWPDGSEELYDLTTDPAGRKNLAAQPTQTALIRTLRTKIEGLVKQ
jgi:iduronate 2-sulfatase